MTLSFDDEVYFGVEALRDAAGFLRCLNQYAPLIEKDNSPTDELDIGEPCDLTDTTNHFSKRSGRA
jgi:hypothetical protein